MKISAAVLRSDALLLATATIWGFAFVAQRIGMDDLGPFAYNAARYALGALALIPLILYRSRAASGKRHDVRLASLGSRGGSPSQAPVSENDSSKAAIAADAPDSAAQKTKSKSRGLAARLIPPILAGSCMFIGASLQQIGLVSTTAGNAAFVTSLYVVIVPLIGVAFGRRVGIRGILAAAIAVAGLYLITVGEGFVVAPGDRFELLGALFWAFHILIIGRFASDIDPVELSAGQFAVCAFFSLIAALALEPAPFAGLVAAAVPVLYGGLFSCGIAFTLQIFAQRTAPPAHASIILALEGLFGAIGGVLILGEAATLRLLLGGALMLGAAILSQIEPRSASAEAASLQKP